MNKNPDYRFNKAIISSLVPFKRYLQGLGESKATIKQKINYAGYFLSWLETEHLMPENTRYNDILSFIDYCQLEGKSKQHINSMLRAIRNLYEYLKVDNPGIINPALNLYMKGIKQKLPSNLIPFITLQELYNEYPDSTDRDKRNKAILGLFIYQGITTEELHQLETNHLDLKQGKIFVPGSRRRNSRELELNPGQILVLYEYFKKVRPKLLKAGARQLFISMKGSTGLKNTLHHMFRSIKKKNPDIKNPKQIRASVITYWLKNHNLRLVQYMAGHKYVSSTERYKLNNLDSLQSNVEKYHPLK